MDFGLKLLSIARDFQLANPQHFDTPDPVLWCLADQKSRSTQCTATSGMTHVSKNITWPTAELRVRSRALFGFAVPARFFGIQYNTNKARQRRAFSDSLAQTSN